MHMVGHHHIAHQQESILSPNSGELLDEHIPCPRCCEQGQPPVTTEGHKMKLTLPVVALQSLRHSTPKIPTLKHRGWGTLATLHPNEVQQWYPLFAWRRQEKTKTSAWATLYDGVGSVKGHVEFTSREGLFFSSPKRNSSLSFISTKARFVNRAVETGSTNHLFDHPPTGDHDSL